METPEWKSYHRARSAIRILLLDDHEVVRRRFCSLLQSKPSFEIVGEAFDGSEGPDAAKDLADAVLAVSQKRAFVSDQLQH